MDIPTSLSAVSDVECHRYIRVWRNFDLTAFRQALATSPLCDGSIIATNFSLDQLFDTYHLVLHSLVDTFAPLVLFKTKRRHLAPWFDKECQLLKRTTLAAEK
jgi:hypothetical protein